MSNFPNESGKRVIFGLAAAALLFIMGANTRLHAAPPPGYSLSWSDEFNEKVGSQPSPKFWNWETGSLHLNGEQEVYVNDVQHSHIVADPTATDGRALQILATNTQGLQSVRMTTQDKVAIKYGFIEARIKLPYGKGIWPAFWMLGSDIKAASWPGCGEMDIMENIGMKSWWGLNQSSFHSPNHSGANSLHSTFSLPSGQTFKDGYHLFQMQWSPNCISYYLDGSLYETRTPSDTGHDPWPFNAPFFFIMNVAVGGDWPGSPDATTIFPQRMLVDYVRVYTGNVMRPKAPTGLRVIPGPDGAQACLTWNGKTGDTGYALYRSTASGGKAAVVQVVGTSYIDSSLKAGTTYSYKVAALNSAGMSQPSGETRITANFARESPYGGVPWHIPGKVALTNFDNGGEGVGYHDANANNKGGLYRPNEHVSIFATQDADSQYDIGYNTSGNWLKFTVSVAAPGVYNVGFRVASAGHGGTLHLENARGVHLTGPVQVPITGGWEKWTTVRTTVKLAAGHQVLKLVEDDANYNLNYMAFDTGALTHQEASARGH